MLTARRTTIHGLLKRSTTFEENGETIRLTATVKLSHIEGNKKPHLSVTGETRIVHEPGYAGSIEACGCLHDLIREHLPEVAEFITFHLWDGLPMHYEANALYWHALLHGTSEFGDCRNALNNDLDYTDPMNPRRMTDRECRQRVRDILKSHVGFGLSDKDTARKLLTKDREEFISWLKERGPDIFAKFDAAVVRIWAGGMPPLRDYKCLECKHTWTAAVEHVGCTRALTSERRPNCPECNSMASSASPFYVKKD